MRGGSGTSLAAGGLGGGSGAVIFGGGFCSGPYCDDRMMVQTLATLGAQDAVRRAVDAAAVATPNPTESALTTREPELQPTVTGWAGPDARVTPVGSLVAGLSSAGPGTAPTKVAGAVRAANATGNATGNGTSITGTAFQGSQRMNVSSPGAAIGPPRVAAGQRGTGGLFGQG